MLLIQFSIIENYTPHYRFRAYFIYFGSSPCSQRPLLVKCHIPVFLIYSYWSPPIISNTPLLVKCHIPVWLSECPVFSREWLTIDGISYIEGILGGRDIGILGNRDIKWQGSLSTGGEPHTLLQTKGSSIGGVRMLKGTNSKYSLLLLNVSVLLIIKLPKIYYQISVSVCTIVWVSVFKVQHSLCFFSR